MQRATIVVDIARPEEVTAAEEWFTKWAPSLRYRSDNQGCGCCVNIWDVEGSDDAMAALPSSHRQGKRRMEVAHLRERLFSTVELP